MGGGPSELLPCPLMDFEPLDRDDPDIELAAQPIHATGARGGPVGTDQQEHPPVTRKVPLGVYEMTAQLKDVDRAGLDLRLDQEQPLMRVIDERRVWDRFGPTGVGRQHKLQVSFDTVSGVE